MEWAILLAIAAGLWYFNQDTTAPLYTPPATQQDFCNMFLPIAEQIKDASAIPIFFDIAQAALESDWGKSNICTNALNFFGIEADSSWTGDVYVAKDGTKYRKYASPEDSWLDHATFLVTNSRYKPAFQYTDDVNFANAVAAAGYADNSLYSASLQSIIATVQGMLPLVV